MDIVRAEIENNCFFAQKDLRMLNKMLDYSTFQSIWKNNTFNLIECLSTILIYKFLIWALIIEIIFMIIKLIIINLTTIYCCN